MPTARLTDRGLLNVSGPDATTFLDRIVTCDVDGIAPGQARFGALLTPQGKIVADFILIQVGEAEFMLDTPRTCLDDLIKRLNLYRLRAKVALADRSEAHLVTVGWGGSPMPEGAVLDPRLPALGWRGIVASDAPAAPDDAGMAAYRSHRISLGIPEGGADFAFREAFPHEAMMDKLSGVDFDKGCYVGQEVVSRMQHRGTARTRLVPILFETGEAQEGVDVTAGDRVLGRTGTADGTRALAMLRLDRAQDALASGEPIMVAGHAVRLDLPEWAGPLSLGGAAVPAA